MKLNHQRVLITGGAVRVGAALARGFAAAGAHVVVHCRNSRAEAETLVRELPGGGHQVVTADLARPDAADAIFDRIGEPVTILVNNASCYRRERDVLNAAAERDYFDVNYFAPLALIRRFAAQSGVPAGAVVNLLDQEIGRTAPRGGAYIHSRRALADATLELAKALAPRIRVNAVAPGPVLPPVWLPESRMAKTLPEVPLGRQVALDDLVSAVLFLAANDSITGDILFVDGGQHLN